MTSDTPDTHEQHGQTITLRPLNESDDEAAKAAKYANLVLGSRFTAGDEVRVVRLERVEPSFFASVEDYFGYDTHSDPLYGEFKRNPEIVAIPAAADPEAALPDEFHPLESGWSR